MGTARTTLWTLDLLNSLDLDFLDVLSNGDLIAFIDVGNANVGSSQFALSINNFLARIDQETGKIIWAYAYFFNEVGSQITPYNVEIKNDTIWIAGHIQNLFPNINDTHGVIMKFDAGGGLQDSYVIPSIQLNNITLFLKALFLDDGSYVAYWISKNEESGFAVSSNSFQ